MKISKLIILFLIICILSILTVSLAGCYRNGNIIIEDCTVKYDGQSHAVVATNDINGDFTYRYVSKELDYDSEQAPIEVGKYTVTVSKKGYKRATCDFEITTDFLFDENGNVIGIEKNNDRVLYIPSKIKGKEVKEIENLVLSETVKEMYLPSTLEKITYEAFAYCYEISGELILPNSLEYLGERAFFECDKLIRIIDNSQITIISRQAFGNCWMLTSYVFNDVLERIEEEAFICTHLKSAILPNSLKYIGKYALYVNEFIDVVIPEGMEKISDMPFERIGTAVSKSSKYVFEYVLKDELRHGYLIRTADRVLMNLYEWNGDGYIIPDIQLNGICDQIYEELIRKGIFDSLTLTINSSIKEYKYDKPIMEKGHIVIPEHITEQPLFNVEVGGGFIYESAIPPKMPDTESLRMDGKEIIVPKGSIDAYKQAFSKYANADELIAKLVEAQ